MIDSAIMTYDPLIILILVYSGVIMTILLFMHVTSLGEEIEKVDESEEPLERKWLVVRMICVTIILVGVGLVVFTEVLTAETTENIIMGLI